MATSLGPGDRIESRCTRCNDITGHVIVALVGGEIIKVECLACRSVHKYHPPVAARPQREAKSVCRVKAGEARKDAVSAVRPARSSASAHTENRATAKSRKAADEIEQTWQRSLNLSAAAPKPYAITTSYTKGDVVEHPVFGMGVVQEVQGDRMHLLFREGLKLLKCGA